MMKTFPNHLGVGDAFYMATNGGSWCSLLNIILLKFFGARLQKEAGSSPKVGPKHQL